MLQKWVALGSVDPTAIWKNPKATPQRPPKATFVKSSIWSSRARTCWYKFIIWVYDLGRATGSDMLSKANYFLERKQMIGLHLCSVRSVCFFWTGSGDKFLSIMLDMQWIPTWNGIFSPSRITLAGRLTPLSGLYCQLDKCHFETATTASPGQVLTQAGAHIVNMHRCMRYIQIRSIILHWATNHPWSRLGLTWLKKLHDVRQKIECPNRILKSQNRRLPCRYICNCTCRITINHSEDQQDPRNYSQLFPQNSRFFSKPLKFSLDRRNKGIFKTVPFLKTVKAPFQPIHCPHL